MHTLIQQTDRHTKHQQHKLPNKLPGEASTVTEEAGGEGAGFAAGTDSFFSS